MAPKSFYTQTRTIYLIKLAADVRILPINKGRILGLFKWKWFGIYIIFICIYMTKYGNMYIYRI